MFKNFFACKIVAAANQRYPGNIQRFFRLQKCLSRKPSVSWKYSKTFSAAKMSQQQPIKILKIFKYFFACKIVLAASQRYPGNIQRFFRLKNCRSRKSATSWKQSNIFPPAKLSQQQPIIILKIFKDFFACKNALAKNHLYPGIFQRLFRLQNCLSRKSAISWKHSKIFPPAKMSQQQPIITENIQRLFRLQNCLSRKSSISWKYSKTFSPAKNSQQQPIIILKRFKDFFACKIVVAANQRYPGKFKYFSACKIVLAATH